jgi:DNA-binding NarL/FixJ family response regulator
MPVADRSRFLATLLGYAGACTSAEEFRRQVLTDLRSGVGCDGALFRPGPRWAGSRALYLDEDARFTDLYVQHAARFGPELTRWCTLSRGREAFIDTEIYGGHEQSRMAAYAEMMRPSGVKSLLACPLVVDGETVGLVFLFRRGRAAPFPASAAAAASAILGPLALADALVSTAFAHGEPRGPAPPGDEDPFGALGPREQQVAMLLAQGLQRKEIAALLGSSPHTVQAQTGRIYDKLGLRHRAGMALLARRLRLLETRAADPVLSSFGALLCRGLSRRFGDAAAPAPTPAPASPPGTVSLGPREREVADMVVQGLTSEAIAARLGTSFHTVRSQIRRVYEKLGVRDRASLALQLGRPDSPFE